VVVLLRTRRDVLSLFSLFPLQENLRKKNGRWPSPCMYMHGQKLGRCSVDVGSRVRNGPPLHLFSRSNFLFRSVARSDFAWPTGIVLLWRVRLGHIPHAARVELPSTALVEMPRNFLGDGNETRIAHAYNFRHLTDEFWRVHETAPGNRTNDFLTK
jgi:hypothetical protein